MEPPLEESGQARDKIIGINVNGLMYNGGYNRKNMFKLRLDYPKLLPDLVIALLEQNDCEIWLVPHTYAAHGSVESDNEACLKLRNALPIRYQERVRIVAGEYDQYEIKAIIGMCDFFIGSRMHSCIAALSQGIPCIGIAYSMKFAGVFESVGVADWVIDARSSNNEETLNQSIELYEKRISIRADLKRNAEEAKAQLCQIFSNLIKSSA